MLGKVTADHIFTNEVLFFYPHDVVFADREHVVSRGSPKLTVHEGAA